jgi:hypothetical protein
MGRVENSWARRLRKEIQRIKHAAIAAAALAHTIAAGQTPTTGKRQRPATQQELAAAAEVAASAAALAAQDAALKTAYDIMKGELSAGLVHCLIRGQAPLTPSFPTLIGGHEPLTLPTPLHSPYPSSLQLRMTPPPALLPTSATIS